MPSRSKKNQAERLRRKRMFAEARDAGAIMGVTGPFVHIDWNKLQEYRLSTRENG